LLLGDPLTRLRRLTDWRKRRLRSTLSPKGAREKNQINAPLAPLGERGRGGGGHA
jgi:hypothetical protein